jgi:hypothetical protein
MLVGCKSPLGRPLSDDERTLSAVQSRIEQFERVRAEALAEIETQRLIEASLQLKIAEKRQKDRGDN